MPILYKKQTDSLKRNQQPWESLGSSWVSLGASWEGLRASLEVLRPAGRALDPAGKAPEQDRRGLRVSQKH